MVIETPTLVILQQCLLFVDGSTPNWFNAVAIPVRGLMTIPVSLAKILRSTQ